MQVHVGALLADWWDSWLKWADVYSRPARPYSAIEKLSIWVAACSANFSTFPE
jgi:hypothetical protein